MHVSVPLAWYLSDIKIVTIITISSHAVGWLLFCVVNCVPISLVVSVVYFKTENILRKRKTSHIFFKKIDLQIPQACFFLYYLNAIDRPVLKIFHIRSTTYAKTALDI